METRAYEIISDQVRSTKLKDLVDYASVLECECGVTSPIERVLNCAIDAAAEMHHMGIDEHHFSKNGPQIIGLSIRRQVPVGRYRADMICYWKPTPQSAVTAVAVECDGTTWHERNEDERRKEKARDRFFVTQGYVVFRYTGKEIFTEPMRCAGEIIEYLRSAQGKI